MLIEAFDFEIGHDIEVLALQGDWDLTNQPGPSGEVGSLPTPSARTRLA
jgi:hypothetical protein